LTVMGMDRSDGAVWTLASMQEDSASVRIGMRGGTG
jgi:hypothetical protein